MNKANFSHELEQLLAGPIHGAVSDKVKLMLLLDDLAAYANTIELWGQISSKEVYEDLWKLIDKYQREQEETR